MGETVARSCIIGVRYSQQEREFVEGQAYIAGMRISDYVRRLTLVGIPETATPTVPGRLGERLLRSSKPAKSLWTIEWQRMEEMSPAEAAAHFRKRAKGRTLPDNFRGWLRASKIRWLDRHWPLGEKQS